MTETITLDDGTLIEVHHRMHTVDTIDPFEVRKHGSHDQSSHGNWARGISTKDVKGRLGKSFPNAKVMVGEGVDLGTEFGEGITDGMTRMAKEFPGAASEVTLIRIDPTATQHIAEVRANRRRLDDGTWVNGLSVHVNSDRMTIKEYESVVLDTSYEFDGDRPNVSLSTESKTAWAESVMVHEYGHLVHDRALQKVTGRTFFTDDGEFDQLLWEETALPPFEYAANGKPTSFFPETRGWNAIMSNSAFRQVSEYATKSRAELVAEVFAIRNGPPGVRGTVSPELNAMVAEMEEMSR